MITKQLANYLILRVTNVYGQELRSKNFISNLVAKIYSGDKIDLKLPIDQFATPIYAGDIAKIVIKLILTNKVGYYNISSSDYFSRFQLGLFIKNIVNFSQDNISLKPVKTEELNQLAKRPLNGGLINSKLLNDFPELKFTTIEYFINKIIKIS
jgi:dTDP-4-dehydrorhamnose reductase